MQQSFVTGGSSPARVPVAEDRYTPLDSRPRRAPSPATRLLWSLLLVIGLHYVGAAGLSLTPLDPPQQWSLAEFRIDGVPNTTNAFDPDLVAVDATIRAPSGREWKVPGFWYQPYLRGASGGRELLTAFGAPGWRLRFTPVEAGPHRLVLVARTNVATVASSATNEYNVSAPATPPRQPGFVRVKAGARYFETDQGAPLPLIGHCVCWYGSRGTLDYDDWFGSMQQAGENYARLWMAPWAFGLEAEAGTLTNYRLDRAWQLDYVLQLAEKKGIYLMLCLDYHGMFEVEPDYWGGNNYWPKNPYNTAQGGPCTSQDAFLTNAAARKLYQKRLRYLIARYGYSQNLLAWQFFNEIDNVARYLDATHLSAWHGAQGDWLKANDPWQHLVTTSLSGADRPELWGLKQMDFAVHHSYGQPQPAATLPAIVQTLLTRYQKPVMIGEFGTDWRGWRREQDPFLRGWRQGVWAGALGGSLGPSMSWWWEQIQGENLYPFYTALGSFLGRTRWGQGTWTPLGFQTTGEPPLTVGDLVPGGTAFNAQLALGSQWGAKPKGQLALANPLSGTLASTYLNCYVHGTGHPELRVPLRVHAWLDSGARLVLHVNSVSDGARMAVFRDGAKLYEKDLPNLDGTFQVNNEYNQDFNVELPAGRHTIEVRNTGGDWFYLDWVRFEGVLPATYPNGWQPSPIAAGLRGEAESLVYVVSPQVSFPANATNAVIESTRGAALVITNLPAGRYQASWYDPATAAFRGETAGTSDGAQATLPLPEFREDLAGRIRRAGEFSLRSPRWVAPHEFQADLLGEAGRVYQIEYNDSLLQWNPLLVVSNQHGTVSFADPNAGPASGRWYRARLAP